ncbi:MAG TPA: hypothetical protein VGG64_21635 [Pirellulales bacterium]|jgi:hypothetical protein
MRLPNQQATMQRRDIARPGAPAKSGLVPSGCDVGCLLLHAPQCLPLCLTGNIPGCIACVAAAGANCCH